ncbi:MAG: prepilin-type N-terminal cleavage/methylation domain-containing protein [Gammaproteobacteria bacterium]|nr:MAG: prepilin-type N-terminal cleavage/methylation domain-containing protein [Gammaproteobacteria bacterium]
MLCSNTSSPRDSAFGFTLIELLITLVIAISITALSATAYSRLSSSAALKATSQDILVTLRRARISAIAKSEEVAFSIDNEKRIYWVVGSQRQRLIDSSLDLQIFSAKGLSANKNISQIRFAPDGSSSGGEIKISNGKKMYSIVVEWLSGKVEIR